MHQTAESLKIAQVVDSLIPRQASVYVDDPELSFLYLRNDYHTHSYIPVPVFHFLEVEDRHYERRMDQYTSSLIDLPNDFIILTRIDRFGASHPHLASLLHLKYLNIHRGDSTDAKLQIWTLKK